jgi:hypothetical protein
MGIRKVCIVSQYFASLVFTNEQKIESEKYRQNVENGRKRRLDSKKEGEEWEIVSIERCYTPFFYLMFKLWQLPNFVLVELPRKDSLGCFLIRLFLAPMLKKRFEGHIVRFLASSIKYMEELINNKEDFSNFGIRQHKHNKFKCYNQTL